MLAFGFGMAIMMSYISASPFVYQDIIGLATEQYGLAFAVNAIGLVVATAVGAIAGIIPALVAVRSRVIDAIRF